MSLVRVSDIFDFSYGTKLDLNKMEIVQKRNNDTVNYISRTSKNNGNSAIVKRIKDINPIKSGAITVSLGGTYVLSSFFHDYEFYTAQNVGILRPKIQLTNLEILFYCQSITANRFRYGAFGREANRTLKDLLIPSKDSIPNWVNEVDLHQFENSNQAFLKTKPPEINAKYWKYFEYQNLFDIKRGKGPRIKDLDGSGSTPVVTSSDSNNGWTAVTNVQPIHDGNTIGVNRNGSIAEAFYQPIPFCSTEDVHIFEPKFKMNKYIGLFISTLIKKEKYRYNYGRKWGITRMKVSKIKLPVDKFGKPDFEFMEKYIKSLPYSASL
jgi:hypothetical protein